jgi:signal peptidase I
MDQPTLQPPPPNWGLTCLVVAVLIPSWFMFLFVAYVLVNFEYQTVHVSGPAMQPAISSDDYLLAKRLAYTTHPPRRGDIVLLRNPTNDSRDLIKRVIGLPGERVLVRDCMVLIDERPLSEPYVKDAWSQCDPRWPAGDRAATLGPNQFFVLGDNRDHSLDSRAFGPVTRGEIEARVSSRILPLAHFGPVDGPLAHFT